MTRAVAARVPDPEARPLLTVGEAGALLGLSRSAAYRAAEAGQLPTIRLGARLCVPTAALRRLLQLDEPAPTSLRVLPRAL
jgi:excisionase family DNA binding protein